MKNLVQITLFAVVFLFAFNATAIAQNTLDDGYGEDIALFLDIDELDDDQLDDQVRLVVYPSPANGDQIQIKYDNLVAKSTVTVYDANGRPVRTENVGNERINKGVLSMSINGLSSGFYLVKLVSGNFESMQKILIQK